MTNNVALDANVLSVIQLHANECNCSLAKPLDSMGQTMFFMADGMFKQYIRKELNKLVSDIMMLNPDDGLFTDDDISLMTDEEVVDYISAHTEPTFTDDANNKFYLVEVPIITPSKEFKLIGGYVMHPIESPAMPLDFDRFFAGDVFEYFGVPMDIELNDLIVIPIFRGWDLKVVTRQQSLIKKYAQVNEVLNVNELDIVDDRINMIQKDLATNLKGMASARAEEIVNIASAHNVKLTEAEVFANLDAERMIRYLNAPNEFPLAAAPVSKPPASVQCSATNIRLPAPATTGLTQQECAEVTVAKNNIDREYKKDPDNYFKLVGKDFHAIDVITLKYGFKVSKAEVRKCSGANGLIAHINSKIASH